MINNRWFLEPAGQHPPLSVNGVCKAYRGVPVLYPIWTTLERGRSLALLGPNGSGKTTLLRLIAGLERPSDGSIDGTQSPVRIGFMGHDSYLYEDMTGAENLRFFAELSGVQSSDLLLGSALAAVDMGSAARDRVRGYSAGMKRRIGMARLFLLQPDVLLLDEPHASLDAEGQGLVDALITDARETGRIVIVASHDREHALALCDQMLQLDSGRTTFHGDTGEWNAQSNLRLLRGGSE